MKYLFVLAVIGLVFISGCIEYPGGCTEEAKMCADGSAVVRGGPDCEFAPCPIECETASDCAAGMPIVYGSDIAVLSCYNRDNLRESPPSLEEPPECGCVDNKCVIKPVITEEEAIQIAGENEDCSDYLTDSVMYNSNTFTWWIDLSLEKEGCAPACVVSEDGSSEINWRCTGLIE